MDKKISSAALVALALGGAVLAGYLLMSRQPPTETPTDTPLTAAEEPDPLRFEPIIEAVPVESAVPDTVDVEFDGTVKIGEQLILDVGFRDLSQMPVNFADYQVEVAKLPSIPGKLAFTFTKFDQIEKLTILPDVPGRRYYYVTYSLTGDPLNPAGPRVEPKTPFDRGVLIPPQPVLIVGDKVFPVAGRDYEPMMHYFGLTHPTHVKFDKGATWTLGGIWDRPDDRLPVIAVEYTDVEGRVRFIKLDY